MWRPESAGGTSQTAGPEEFQTILDVRPPAVRRTLQTSGSNCCRMYSAIALNITMPTSSMFLLLDSIDANDWRDVKDEAFP